MPSSTDPTHKPRLLIAQAGYIFKANFGDEMMSYHLGRILAQGGEHEVTVYSDCEGPGVVNGLTTRGYLRADVIVVGGGGIVSPGLWLFKDGRIDEILEQKKQVIFLNVNVTTDSLSDPEFLKKLLLLKARWWVRDVASVGRLASVGIEAIYLPDVVFKEGVIKKREKIEGRKRLLFFPNTFVLHDLWGQADVGKFVLAHHNARDIAKYLDWMIGYGWEVRILAAQTSGKIDDRIVAAYIYALCKSYKRIAWNPNASDWRALLGEIQDSDFVLSMRYHSTVAAVASGVGVVDIVHHNKNRAFIEDARLSDCAVDYYSLSHERLVTATKFAENCVACAPHLDAYRMSARSLWEVFTAEWDRYIQSLETDKK